VVIPARDEEQAIAQTIDEIRAALDGAGIAHEIIVVDDGSLDRTGEIARAAGVTVLRHPESGGYGKSLKDGILRAQYDLIAITDADGTYPNARLPALVRIVTDEGFDMAVGARTGREYRGTFFKMPARRVFLWLSQYATGRKIDDINSGLRVFRKELAVRYMHTIGDKFSFTTTITLAAMLNGYFVKYVPIEYYVRRGSSHVRYWRDSLRSLQIIVENILYYNPLKLFLLLVNFLLLVALAAGAVYFAAPPLWRMTAFAELLGPLALVGAVVVAAIGLAADLGRMKTGRFDRERPK
jgi:glycosyltransferase involved in cell wall biosynthesis